MIYLCTYWNTCQAPVIHQRDWWARFIALVQRPEYCGRFYVIASQVHVKYIVQSVINGNKIMGTCLHLNLWQMYIDFFRYFKPTIKSNYETNILLAFIFRKSNLDKIDVEIFKSKIHYFYCFFKSSIMLFYKKNLKKRFFA